MRRANSISLSSSSRRLLFSMQANASDPGRSIIPQLQEKIGFSEWQVRGSLGACSSSFVSGFRRCNSTSREKDFRTPTTSCARLTLRGIVTRPLDDVRSSEASLASLGIGQPLASEFAPAVVEYLEAAGFQRESSQLARVT